MPEQAAPAPRLPLRAASQGAKPHQVCAAGHTEAPSPQPVLLCKTFTSLTRRRRRSKRSPDADEPFCPQPARSYLWAGIMGQPEPGAAVNVTGRWPRCCAHQSSCLEGAVAGRGINPGARLVPLILGPWSIHHPLRCARSWEQRGPLSIPVLSLSLLGPAQTLIPVPGTSHKVG